MVNTRANNNQRDGITASDTPPVNVNVNPPVNAPMPQRPPPLRNQEFQVDHMPPRMEEDIDAVVEEVPTNLEIFTQLRQLQVQLRDTQEELRQARAEREVSSHRVERSSGNYSNRSNRAERSVARSQPVPVNDNVVAPIVVPPHATVFRYESFIKCGAKEFDGTPDAVGCMEWLDNIEMVFASCDCPEDKKVLCATRMLKKGARDWWRGTTVSVTSAVLAAMPWTTFKEKFLEEYCGTREKRLLEKEFLSLKKGDKTMSEYARSFMEKLKFVGHLVPTEVDKIAAYTDGIPISYRASCRHHDTLADAIKESKRIDDDYKAEKAITKADWEQKKV